MNKLTALLMGLGAGAGLMYFYDPKRGTQRRQKVRDQAQSLIHQAEEALEATTHDLSQRAQGVVAETRARFIHEPVTDDKLVARVRSEMGHFVTHADEIIVSAKNGLVIVGGPMLEGDTDSLLRRIEAIPGVEGVENRLQPRESGTNVPYLRPHAARPIGAFDADWTPATRLLIGLAGGALALYGKRRKGVVGAFIAPLGMSLLSRGLATTNIRAIAAGGDPFAVTSK